MLPEGGGWGLGQSGTEQEPMAKWRQHPVGERSGGGAQWWGGQWEGAGSAGDPSR